MPNRAILRRFLARIDRQIARRIHTIESHRKQIESLETNGCDVTTLKALVADCENAQLIYLAERNWIAAKFDQACKETGDRNRLSLRARPPERHAASG